MPGPEEDEAQRVAKLFEDMDTDRSGRLDRMELAQLSKLLGMPMTKQQLDEAIKEMDTLGYGEVKLKEFATWWKKQNTGYRMAGELLWTPRGSRIRLDSPRFAKALIKTGMQAHELKQMTRDDLTRGNPMPEILAERTRFTEGERMRKIAEVLAARLTFFGASEAAEERKKVLDAADAIKVAALAEANEAAVAKAQEVRKHQGAIKNSEAAAMSELQRQRELRRKQADARVEEHARQVEVDREAEKPKRRLKQDVAEKKREAAFKLRDSHRDDIIASLDEREHRAEIARARLAATASAGLVVREERTKRAEKRVQRAAEKDSVKLEETKENSEAQALASRTRLEAHKIEMAAAVVAKNKEKRKAAEAKLASAQRDSLAEAATKERESAVKQQVAADRQTRALERRLEKVAEGKALAEAKRLEREEKVAERKQAEAAAVAATQQAARRKEEQMEEAARRNELALAAISERRALEGRQKLDLVLRKARIAQTAQDDMNDHFIEKTDRLATMRGIQKDMVAARESRNIKTVLKEYRTGNPLYSKGPMNAPPQRDRWYEQKGLPAPGSSPPKQSANNRSPKRSASVPLVPMELRPMPKEEFFAQFDRVDGGRRESFGVVSSGRRSRIKEQLSAKHYQPVREKTYNLNWSLPTGFGR